MHILGTELTSDEAGWSRPVASSFAAHQHRRFGTTMKGPDRRSGLEATACRSGTEKNCRQQRRYQISEPFTWNSRRHCSRSEVESFTWAVAHCRPIRCCFAKFSWEAQINVEVRIIEWQHWQHWNLYIQWQHLTWHLYFRYHTLKAKLRS